MLLDNVSEFINLMDAKGNFIFSDRQAKRMERAMANIEFGFGEGGYQPPSSSSATYLMGASTYWSWTRGTSTKTVDLLKARLWVYLQPKHERLWC
ncbi:hypothetical protein PSA5_31440 [Pseudomonas syringae pv. actinidiae]|nr:hypothetical protein PSA5_31440 [Pseudomonas syringae pv. actinidiae]